MSWQPPADAPDPGPLPALGARHVTFGSFNSCYKVTEHTVRVWARVLSAVDRSRLVLVAVPHGQAQARLRKLFSEQGIPGERLEFRPRMSHEAFLEAHREVDIALDAFPYHGTTTTCFSLWMGVPVVSLIGATHVSRVGLTLLSNAGLPELAAQTDDDFVMRAAALAHDPRRLAEIRSGLRQRILASPLADGAGCARALEQAYRAMWERTTAGSEA